MSAHAIVLRWLPLLTLLMVPPGIGQTLDQIVDEYPLTLRFLEENSSAVVAGDQKLKIPAESVLGLTFHSMGLVAIPEDLSRFPHLKYLSVANNRIELNSQDFQRLSVLTNLQYLDLTGNRIRNIQLDIKELARLTNLVSIAFGYNPLEGVSSNLYSITSLKEMLLTKCTLKTLPDGISNLTNLTELNLSFTKFTSLPNDFSKLRIKRLHMMKCGLSDSTIAGLPRTLLSLDLSGNRFQAIPPAILALEQLESLWLPANQITTVTKDITRLQRLKRFHLGNNHITSLPIEVTRIPGLEELYVSGNAITSLDGDLIALKARGVLITE